jgi:hypothetical protein
MLSFNAEFCRLPLYFIFSRRRHTFICGVLQMVISKYKEIARQVSRDSILLTYNGRFKIDVSRS